MKPILSRIAVPLIVLVLVGLSIALGFSLKNSQGGDVSKKIGLDQKLGNKLPLDATFRDEHGKAVRLGSFFGKRPVLLMLVFFSCQGACQLEMENATQAFNEMKTQNVGRDFDVVSISIHPKETAELALEKKSDVLKMYPRPGAYDGWHFLTGDADQIKRVATAIGYRYSYDPVKDQILHPTGLFVATPDGRLSRYLYGVDYATPVISASIDTAAQGQINAPSEPVLLGCFQYDPKTGKTRLNVFRALQISGIGTVLILATSIFFMSRKSPNKPGQRNEEDALH
jgi:protein SCO1/2